MHLEINAIYLNICTQEYLLIKQILVFFRPDTMEIQFILEEVFEKPKNLKALKNMERMTILKRTIEMKPQRFWNNIGWKSLESFKSFLKLKKGKVLNLFNN